MTQDDMVKVARECGIGLAYGRESIERFYTFVAAAEREACAKVCDGWLHANGDDCAAAIRARGEEKSYAAQAAMVESQTQGRMKVDPITGDVSIGTIRARGET